MGNNVFRYFLEWLKNKMHEEAYQRLVKNLERREKMYKGRKTEESAAFVGPGWVSGQTNVGPERLKASEPIIQFDVKDQMFTLANSVVNSIDGLWQTYFPGGEKQFSSKIPTQVETLLNDVREWQRIHKGKKHPQLWELAQAEGDEDWLDWIHDHIWTYIGLSAPLLGAINPVRAVISGENMGMPMADNDARIMELCKYMFFPFF